MSQPDSDRSSSESPPHPVGAGRRRRHRQRSRARLPGLARRRPTRASSWHAYQLIGDVLRSDDLAAEPAADEAFLVALRARLADRAGGAGAAAARRAERPRAAAGRRQRRGARRARRWQGPVAMAAGFLAVIGGINFVRPFSQRHRRDAWRPTPRRRPGAGRRRRPSTTAAGRRRRRRRRPAQTQAAADQLAPYLAAHRQSTMSGPFQMPGGDIRNVSLVQPAQ